MGTMDPKLAGSQRDHGMMGRCLELARESVKQGEYPFGCVIAREGDIVAEGVSHTVREADESRHAEIIAISNAKRNVGPKMLRQCTLYSTVEPCAMCAFAIWAAGIRKVVFSLHSPVIGGSSRWDILRATSLRLRFLLGPKPEVVSGVLAEETLRELWEWRPLIARAISKLGIFVHNGSDNLDDGRQANAPATPT